MNVDVDPRRLEEAAMNAWPALQTTLLDGWILRFAGGYTKRANSVNPTYPAHNLTFADKIATCESLFARRGLPCIFRLTSFGAPSGLDALLDERGFRLFDRSLVLHRHLARFESPGSSLEVRHSERETWLESYVALSGSPL